MSDYNPLSISARYSGTVDSHDRVSTIELITFDFVASPSFGINDLKLHNEFLKREEIRKNRNKIIDELLYGEE